MKRWEYKRLLNAPHERVTSLGEEGWRMVGSPAWGRDDRGRDCEVVWMEREIIEVAPGGRPPLRVA